MLAAIGDKGRQEPGRAEPPMRRSDRADAFDAPGIIEQHAAAAIHLHVDESRREQPFDRPALDACINSCPRQPRDAPFSTTTACLRASARHRRYARR
jgi:hypothetical protein